MGNSQELQGVQSIDYKKLEKIQEKSNLFYDVMRQRTLQGHQYSLYHFPLVEQRKLADELKDYKKRLQTSTKDVKTHVQIHGVDIEESPMGFLGSKKIIRVLTERVPFLLSEIKSQLSPEDAHIILYNSLKGYQALQVSFGNVQVNDKKIGFTEKGQIKIWIQSNFGMNYVSQRSISQAEMVHSIFNTVLRRTDESKFDKLMDKNGEYLFGTFDLAIPYLYNQIKFAQKRELDQNIINDIKAKMQGSQISKNSNSHNYVNSSRLGNANRGMVRVNESNLKSSGLKKSASGSSIVFPFKKTGSTIKEA